jgi:DNA-binding beta-propeller fold protein YncE
MLVKLFLRVAAVACLLVLVLAFSQLPRKKINLPTSKTLTAPSPGHVAATNNFPATIALSPDGRYAALLNNGFGAQESQGYQSIAVLDLHSNQLADFPDERLPQEAQQSYFLGLAFGSDGKRLYASVGSITDPTGERHGNTGNGIAVYDFAQGKVKPEGFLKIGPQPLAAGKRVPVGLFKLPKGQAIPYPAGLVMIPGPSGDRLLVANNYSDNVVLLDVASGHTVQSFDLSTNETVPSSYPYTVVATRDGRRAWCSLWNASKVAELDLAAGKVVRWIALLEPKDSLAPGSHPTALLLSPDEKVLYVALSNSDAVATFDAADGRVVHIASTNLRRQNYAGSYPTALAQSADGSRLFVADSSLNAIAVFDQAKLRQPGPSTPVPDEALGFIPTDWYPSAVAVSGDDLLIATAKGQGTGPNNGGSDLPHERRRREHPYIATLLRGSIARLNFAKAEQSLATLTRQVEEDNLLHSDPGKIEFRSGGDPIRHVIYILKENRTYDQIFGDLKVGDGDPSLTMYGEQITPNEHKLARQFGVLDNFYDSGEVSGNGHVWSTAAITSDYTEKNWQIGYRGQQRTYDSQGTMADEYAIDHDEADINDPQSGFLWGNLAAHGLSYRVYGEYINGEWCTPRREKAASWRRRVPVNECSRDTVRQGEPLPGNVGNPHGSASPWPWPIPLVKRMVATKRELRDHYDPLYPDFNTSYPDQLRADQFLNEFEEFVRARKEGKGTELPNFVLLYLPNDHTAGKRPNSPTPAAAVADNDLAFGRIVEAVSHSPYWDDTAIFAVEDDAQDGYDHVDAHRSIAFIISKYSPGSAQHPYIAHQFYTTVNLVHTMEALLGLPPMNQNDAYAPLMSPLFAGPGNQPPYEADWRNRHNELIYKMNPGGKGPDVAASEQMDFSRPDAVNTPVLNAILWRDAKGDVPEPKRRHTVFALNGKRE